MTTATLAPPAPLAPQPRRGLAGAACLDLGRFRVRAAVEPPAAKPAKRRRRRSGSR